MKKSIQLPLFLGQLFCMSFIFNLAHAQTESGYLPSDPAYISSLPVMTLSPESALLTLPIEVDNSSTIYFPRKDNSSVLYIYDQSGTASCQSVSTIFNTYAYEVNRLRNLPSNSQYTRYAPNFSWNHLNEGHCGWQGYTSLQIVHDFLKESGAMNDMDFDGPAQLDKDDCRRWPTGYELYNNTLQNKLDEVTTIEILLDGSGLEELKHYLYDHNEGSSVGGVVTFGAREYGQTHVPLVYPSTHEGEMVRTKIDYVWGGHSVTIIGYCDDVMFDWGGAGTPGAVEPDGEYRNDKDNNLDGVIDMSDWEIGAVKIVNSYDTWWGTEGFEWVLYCCLPNDPQYPQYNEFYALTPKVQNDPEVVLKLKIDNLKRDDLRLGCGYGLDANATTYVGDAIYYTGYDNDGGDITIQGADVNGVPIYGPIEILLDYSHFFPGIDFGKVFLINENTGSSGGQIISYSLVDYRWDETFELAFDQTNFPIGNPSVVGINYDLIPHESNITSNMVFNSDMVSRFTPTISDNSIMTITEGVHVDMYDSEMIIESGSALIIEDNATITGKRGQNELIINGSIQIGENVQFVSETGATLKVKINSSGSMLSMNNVTFDRCELHNYSESLTVSNSTFINCGWAYSFHGDVTIDDCAFTDTWLYLENGQNAPDLIATVSNSVFNNTNSHVGVDLWNYGKYFITDNNIKANHNGIQILNCGDANTGNQLIFNNNIHDCGKSGIIAYNVTGSITQNHIFNNYTGLKLMNNSNIALFGNPGAGSFDEMNYITDNQSYEIYISKFSFPWYFRFNAIIDEDNAGNPTDPLLYFAYPVGNEIPPKDVRYNCWGNNFNASEDLYPSEFFIYNPTWCPGGSSIPTTEAEQLYKDGREQFESGQYNDSKATFMLLIDQFTKTEYASSAMKELVVLEKFASNAYESLKNYYQTNDSIQADTILQKLAFSLANKCDLKLENWPEAISHYESIISEPETLEDSVFAIIDLGYVYFLMENSSYKSAYTGKLTEYKPSSRDQFFDHRDYLLSLLPGDNMSESMIGNIASLSEGELFQNVPNPFRGNTQIWYRLENESTVQLNVYNYTGQLIRTINEGTKTKGNHHIDFDATGLKNGIYFYSISINGKITDSKKMTIMK